MCTRLLAKLHENLLPRRPVDWKREGNRHGLSFRLEMVSAIYFYVWPLPEGTSATVRNSVVGEHYANTGIWQ